MKLYKTLTNVILEEITRDSLDTTVFQFFDDGRTPILKDGIKAQICRDIEMLRAIVPVVKFVGVGDLFTPNFTEQDPLDVYVFVDPQDVSAVSAAEVLHLTKKLNKTFAVGTVHPIHYYIYSDPEFSADECEAVYDIANEKWMKMARKIHPELHKFVVQLEQTLDSVDPRTGNIQRNVLDFGEVKALTKPEQREIYHYIKKKYSYLNRDVKHMVYTLKGSKLLSLVLSVPDIDKAYIELLTVRDQVPETIVLKLFQRHYYRKFLGKLKEAIQNHERPS